MAKIDEPTFGSVAIKGMKHSGDVLVFWWRSNEAEGWFADVLQPTNQEMGA